MTKLLTKKEYEACRITATETFMNFSMQYPEDKLRWKIAYINALTAIELVYRGKIWEN